MNTWLSILIPVYNVEAYLGDCLASLVSQGLADVEIIVIDDQSTDNSFSILKKFVSSSHVNVRLLRHAQNKGVSATRNALVDAAVGDYLWFLDSDDVMAVGAVTHLKKIVDLHTPDLIMCDYKRWRPDVVKQKSKENHLASFGGPPGVLLDNGELLFMGLFQKGRLHPWSKISKRCLWDETLRFPEGRYFEDVVVMPKLALRVKRYFYQDSVWIHYRQRRGSIISTPSLKKIEDMSAGMAGILGEWLEKYPNMSAATRSAFNGFYIKIYVTIINDLVKLNQLRPELLCIHRSRLYENIRSNRLKLTLGLIFYGNIVKLPKLFRVFRYL